MSRRIKLVFVCLTLAATAPTARAQHRFVEDFTTTTYRDPASTTADWNTTLGLLRFPPLDTPIISSAPGVADSWDVAVSGSLLLVADGANGLTILDTTNPLSLAVVGMIDTPASAHDVAVAGNLAFVADGPTGMLIVDITDPAAPVLRGTYDSPVAVRDIVPADDLVYIADDTGGIRVVDVTNPDLPVAIGAVDPPGTAKDLALAGDYLYVANGTGGLRVIDVSDVTAPSDAGFLMTGGDAADIEVAGDLAYLACGSTGVRIVDVSDPLHPVLAGQLATTNVARGLSLVGNTLYVAQDTGGLVVVDVSDPGALAIRSTTAMPGPSYGVVVAGEYGFVANHATGVQVVRAAYEVGPAALDAWSLPAQPEDVAVDGDLLVVAVGTAGILTYDISDPAAPVALGSWATSSRSRAVAIHGDLLCVADGFNWFRVLDISDPANPVERGSASTGDAAQDVAVADDFAFVADGYAGLRVMDFSLPDAPSTSAVLDTPGYARSVAISGHRAYVADDVGMIRVIDISRPWAPVETGVGTPVAVTTANDVLVSGDRLIVGSDWHFFQAMDITDPDAPAWAGTYFTSGSFFSTDFAVSGQILFAAGGAYQDLRSVNIKDTANMTTVGLSDTGGNGVAVAVDGDFAYLATDDPELRVKRVFDRESDLAANAARSLPVYQGSYVVHRVRMSVVGPGLSSVAYSVGGENWQSAVPLGTWKEPSDSTGTELRWRIDLWNYDTEIDSLIIEWLDDRPVVAAVTDVVADQGGQVRVEWSRSGRDFAGDSQQVAEYAVYRRIDPAAKAGTGAAPTPESEIGRQHAAAMKAAGWDYLATLPARQEDRYAYVAPTLVDSTVTGGMHWTAFRVTALTASTGVFYDSPVDSGYSVDNLEPNVPANIVAAYAADGVQLDWDDAPDADFRYFRIYRDVQPDFTPSAANLVHETIASAWIDPAPEPWGFHYKVTALDFAGNESAAGTPATVSGVGDGTPPVRTELGMASPNPFNPSTRIGYELAEDAAVHLAVYDAAGRLVRVLVDTPQTAGRHHAVWDGRDRHGRTVAAGVYLYQLEAGDYSATRRMMLVK